MTGPEYGGSRKGRDAIVALAADAGLAVVTAASPHRIEGLLSIDHIAVPATWGVDSCERLVAESAGARLSDHDAYVADVSP